MLKKIIHSVLGKPKAGSSGKTSAASKRVEVPFKDHHINRDLIDHRAIDLQLKRDELSWSEAKQMRRRRVEQEALDIVCLGPDV